MCICLLFLTLLCRTYVGVSSKKIESIVIREQFLSNNTVTAQMKKTKKLEEKINKIDSFCMLFYY